MAESDNPTFFYVPVPEAAARIGLYVTGAGTDVIPSGSDYPRQNHPELYHFNWRTGRVLPEFQLLLISSGSGQFESRETGPLTLEAGDAIMLFPDVWHRYRPKPETGWTEHWISFGGDLMFQWNQRGLFSAADPISKVRDVAQSVGRYQQVIDYVHSDRERASSLMAVHAMAIIADAVDNKSIPPLERDDNRERETSDPMVTKALDVIWNHSHQKISVDMIAKHAKVTRRTLERHFRKSLGHSILHELVSCRIQRAKRLLGETHIPIKHVSYSSGFSSQSNFCKIFRRETDMTPGEYRELMLKKALAKNTNNAQENHTG